VVDAVSGNVVTTSKLPDTASTPPVVAGGVVYILTDDATLTAYK
jgi:outer membrane protein assembly factor BamB